MDGVSVAASIVGIATAGVQVSIKLVTLATQISTASDRVSSIGNDVSLTSGVLHQLGELMTQKGTGDGDGVSILNQQGLETTRVSAAMCQRIFQDIEKEVKNASEQLRRYKPGKGRMTGEKIELSPIEKAKWPFLQPRIDTLRADLRDAKSTLMLMLQVASLALSKRMADASLSTSEHQDLIRAIVALELQRREEGTNNDKPISPLGNSSNSDHNAQTPVLPQRRRKRTKGFNEPRKDSSDKKARSLYWTDGNSNVPGDQTVNLAQSSVSSDIDKKTQTNHNTELQLFLLKPIVTDFFDRIELRWSVQNTNMQPLAIHEHMAKIVEDDLPSVVEMLQQLHAYEQKIVDSEASKDSGGSVLSLKRTKTDIQSRDMLFKEVPGLQFVIQRPVRFNAATRGRPRRTVLGFVRAALRLTGKEPKGKERSDFANNYASLDASVPEPPSPSVLFLAQPASVGSTPALHPAGVLEPAGHSAYADPNDVLDGMDMSSFENNQEHAESLESSSNRLSSDIRFEIDGPIRHSRLRLHSFNHPTDDNIHTREDADADADAEAEAMVTDLLAKYTNP